MVKAEDRYQKEKVHLDPNNPKLVKAEDVDEVIFAITDYTREVIKITVIHYIIKLMLG